MSTYPPAYGRERVSLPDKVYCLQILFFLDKLDVTLDVDVRRARGLAGSVTLLENTENIRDRLGILPGDYLSCPQVAVERIGDIHRAGLRAVAAGIALLLIDVSWMYFHRRRKAAGLAPQIGHFREGQDFNIPITCAFDELW